MQFLTVLLALATAANAHYVFPSLITGGAASTEWQYVRQWTGYYSNGPVTDVTSPSIRCNVDGATKTASTQSVAAGSTVGFTAKASISHPGTLQFYLAKVPSGQTAATWDGSGSVWFKIFGQGPGGLGTSQLTWPSDGNIFLISSSSLLSIFPFLLG